ncbi:MAG: sigma 54-interacting transcriptional regulator [Aquificaceae bacterium]|nr:sigma 54-interacting transcriptional regulator [Aquificaceae bacterium]MDW8423919.1 sigma 54-interacting transcriptional regulator [Aquificaceae bacterium]
MHKELNLRELTIINEVGKILSRGYEFTKSLEEVLKVLYSFWDVRHSYVALYRRELKALKILKAFGLTEEEVERGIFRKGEGIVGKVYRDGVPVFLPDIRTNAYLNKTGLRERIKQGESFAAVPIKIGGEIIGVLAVFKDFGEESVERSVELLMIIGTMIGMLYKLDEKINQEREEWEEEKRLLTKALSEKYSVEGIVGKSPAVRKLLELVEKVAQTDANVLITGESGTGKSLVAKAIHFMSKRKEKPFITINCSAIPETLLEAELFGYEKGSFTGAYTSKKGKFELANGGTIFLDEIGDMPLSLQPKILRVIQDKEIERLGSEKTIKVDVRIISATNKNLSDLVAHGQFREDLYYRLNVLPIHIPPLRERKEDIPVLVDYFLEIFNQRYNKKVRLHPKVIEIFIEYAWYGNVRELENIIERLVILKDGLVRDTDLPPYFFVHLHDSEPKKVLQVIENTEREEILKALEKTGYVKSKAARLLGYTLRQLDYRIKKYSIPLKRY